MRWAAPAHQPEPGALFSPRDDVRRRWARQFRPAGSSGENTDPLWVGTHHWRAGRRTGPYAQHLRDPDSRALCERHEYEWRHEVPAEQFPGRLQQRIWSGHEPDRHGAEHDWERRRKSGPLEHATISYPELQHRPSGHIPVADIGGRRWHNLTLERSRCSRAPSLPL